VRSIRSILRRGVPAVTLFVAGALVLTACGSSDAGSAGKAASASSASPNPAHFAYASTSPLASVLGAQTLNTWKDFGIDVTVDPVPDVGTATDLAIGKKAEFGHSAPTTAFAAMSQGVPITIIAGLGFGQGDHQAGFLTSLASSGIKSLKDLKGKRVAVTGIGTSYDFYLRAALQGVGLEAGKDVQILPVPYPQMRGALSQGQVDAALLLAVDYARLKDQQPVNVIATTAELAGAPMEVTGVVVARNDFLKDPANKATVVAFLAGLLKSESTIEDDVANNKADKTIAMLQPVLKYDAATMAAYQTYRLSDVGRESKLGGLLRVPKAFVNPALKSLRSGGGLPGKTEVTYKSAVDLSFLKAAYAKAGLTWNEDVKYP
jgi:ABC-type nitrate/sulfonate/bicarbonate transport system substrate-binding protein